MVSCRDSDCVAYAVDNGGCTNFDCDWAVPQYWVGGPRLSDEGPEPYISNARFHLDELRRTVQDGLIGPNDDCLRDSLLEDINAIDFNLRKALS